MSKKIRENLEKICLSEVGQISPETGVIRIRYCYARTTLYYVVFSAAVWMVVSHVSTSQRLKRTADLTARCCHTVSWSTCHWYSLPSTLNNIHLLSLSCFHIVIDCLNIQGLLYVIHHRSSGTIFIEWNIEHCRSQFLACQSSIPLLSNRPKKYCYCCNRNVSKQKWNQWRTDRMRGVVSQDYWINISKYWPYLLKHNVVH